MTTDRSKPRIGRPPLPPEERKARRLLVAMTEAQHEALLAWASDRPLGPLLIETAMHAARRAG